MHSYSTDNDRWKIYLYLGAIAFAASLGSGWIVQRLLGKYEIAMGSLSFAFTSLVVYRLFATRIWNWEIIRKAGLVAVPDFNGKWKGHLYTSYEDAEPSRTAEIEHEGLTPMEATVTISQTWDEILVYLEGPDSPSESEGATILVEGQWPTLTYNYDNPGRPHHDEINSHYGTTMLDYNPEEDSFSGIYYTGPDRGNTGRLELKRVEK
ncbi:hypothetical protein C479_04507 [Halovivax asiaticus JCM 14624]|uniref:CD-NTase-associated protein 15 domain-containing protein n=1 Tax=Halovivax asiaticus JCM 14624 TaxID=1227490 RepID=M0BQJ0_9EURY|nr:hypothetical protein [Halovivax asiaticus]ELZ12628.1 hypothetical protein C479_04507 [Halovivax asiaticus JCM 14624]